ncbi:hypothetical protein SDC9_63438 [bioreactor metagenome]|uniref:Uncharacterized protein n=1 Tax=bioreactor metagenome TaxID=1076179 RepID=A0A644XSE8_9ZZZZ
MKAKTVRGKGFRGVLDYALKKSGAEIVGGNMSGENARELAAEFGEVRRLREEIEKPVWHCALSLPEGERLSSEQWGKVATAFITRMGIDPMENQFVVVQHKDTTHDHAHIIVNRIKPDGSIWNHRNDVYKAITTTQELEGLFSLTKTPGREAKVFAQPSFTKGEIEKHKRTGEFPAKVPVSKAIAEVTAAGPMDPVTFIQAMEARGIEAVPNVSKTGRMNGFSFQYQGVALKGSDVGAAWKKLSEVVQYEPDRDAERLRSIKKTSKRRGITGNRDADSPVTSGAGREGEGAPGGIADRVGDTVPGGSPDLFPVGAGTRGAADGVSGCYGGDEEAGEKAPLEKANPYSDGGDGVSGWGGVVDTLAILARGEQPDVQTDSHLGEVSSVAAPSRNLRLQAWYKQAACLGAPQYRVTVIDRDAERTAEYNRRWNEKHPDEQPKNLDDTHAINLCRGKDGEEHLWSAEEVANNISTLEYYNVNRYDIYVTPMDPKYHHILIDDLTTEGVTHIKAHYTPCLIQTSSENNFQSVIRVPRAEVSPDEQSAANLLIQRLNHLPDGCGGDRGISAPVHTFRMMGFHNKKPGRNNARTDIVFYRPGAVCPAAAEELEECRAEIRKKRATTAAAPRTTTEKSSVTAEIDFGSPTPFDAVFEREWSRQAGLARYQVARGKWGSVDDSTVDFRTCKELLRRGYGTEEIASSFKRKSPGLVRRHRAWEDYISRTLQAAGSALAEALEECVDEAAQHYDGR